MGVLDSAKEKLTDYMERKSREKQEKEDIHRQITTEREVLEDDDMKRRYADEARLAVKNQAAIDASNKTGLAKMRAINELYKSDNRPRPKWMKEMSQFTNANKLRTQRNKERTAAIKAAVLEDKQRKMNEIKNRNAMQNIQRTLHRITARKTPSPSMNSKPRLY